MDISLDNDIDTTNPVEFDLFILVVSPVAHADKVGAAGLEFLVAFGQDGIRVEFMA